MAKLKITPKIRNIVSIFKIGYKTMKEKPERAAPAVPYSFYPGKIPKGVSFPAVPYFPGYKAPEEEKAEEAKPEEGIEIVSKGFVRRPVKAIKEEDLTKLNVYYPLIPRSPKKGEFVFAYANIRWDPKLAEPVYNLVEPAITEGDKEVIEKIKRDLEERLDIDFTKLGAVEAKEVLRKEIEKSMADIIRKEFPTLDESKKAALIYYIERDTVGFGKIEGLMADPNIEDLSCDGVNIPMFVYHRDPRLGPIRTNVTFTSPEKLNSFVVILAQKCNKTISIAEPLLDGALPDGSRVQATLGTDIARKGSNFTIRKFSEKPLTPTHMLKYKTLDSTQLAYLWLAVENRQSILISGGTATGKTSLLNALSLFIKPSLKVVSIEDTAELRLQHPHWIPHVARAPLSIKGKVGEVSLFDLLKTSLRQRPDYIIVGEVRGKEAFVLFQQMATGHPSLATMHAASISQLVDRLIAPPISLPPSLLENINIIVFLTLSRLKERYVRRGDAIVEVTGVKENRPTTLKIFEWKAIEDTFEVKQKSVVLRKIAKASGLTEDTIKEEILRRKKILEWMLAQEMFDYRDVANIIQKYYTDPEGVMDMIGV